MKIKPFDLLTPLSKFEHTSETVKEAIEADLTINKANVQELTSQDFIASIGIEPDPTLVKLDTLASPEVASEAKWEPATLEAIYPVAKVTSSALEDAMGLLKDTRPAGTTAEDIPLVAVKFDAGKTDWSLLPIQATEEIIKVLEFGAAKYDKNNWAKGSGFLWTRPFNAMLRHLWAWLRGEDNDPESGLSHIAHVGCNVLFLLTFILNKERYNQDDRNV